MHYALDDAAFSLTSMSPRLLACLSAGIDLGSVLAGVFEELLPGDFRQVKFDCLKDNREGEWECFCEGGSSHVGVCDSSSKHTEYV